MLPLGADEPVGKWEAAGKLSVGRYAPGAVLLGNGKALVAGGFSFETGETHRSSELFDPASAKWTAGPEMKFDRNFPLVLPLPDAGGVFALGFRAPGGTTAASERLPREGERFVTLGPAAEERELASATRLADGRFLITGGYSTLRRKTLDSAEIFDPKTERFTPTAGTMAHVRFGHTSILLPDGTVLVVGGKVLKTNEDVRDAELFDPATGTFTPTGSLAVGRDRCTAWLLRDGKSVLVAGGSAKEGGTAPARRCELYEIAGGKFSPGPELLRDRMAHTATALGDGRVLLVGGWSTSDSRTTRQAEIWDPETGAFHSAGMTQVGRHDLAAVLLADGRVLIAGGKEAPARDGAETPLEAEIWTPR